MRSRPSVRAAGHYSASVPRATSPPHPDATRRATVPVCSYCSSIMLGRSISWPAGSASYGHRHRARDAPASRRAQRRPTRSRVFRHAQPGANMRTRHWASPLRATGYPSASCGRRECMAAPDVEPGRGKRTGVGEASPGTAHHTTRFRHRRRRRTRQIEHFRNGATIAETLDEGRGLRGQHAAPIEPSASRSTRTGIGPTPSSNTMSRTCAGIRPSVARA